MTDRRRLTYAESGVDILAEESAIKALTKHFRYKRKGFGSPIDVNMGYAGLLNLGDYIIGITTDGVGSKVLVATEMDNWRTIGIDCIAMNVNDLYAMGLEPIAFVDYLAMESVEPSITDQIGIGLENGARIAKISIVGGETASLPEIIRGFDLAGTCIGITKKGAVVTGERIVEGDAIIGIPSSGIHSNGLTLARKLLTKYSYYKQYEAMERILGEELLVPTRIYSEVLSIVKNCEVHGLAHITGGGILNLRRLTHLGFDIFDPLEPQAIFKMIYSEGVDIEEMYKTFNMGMGFTIIAPYSEIEKITDLSSDAKVVGKINGRGIKIKTGGRYVEIVK
jgi:phosphoribosylformylglycinamidine cyclo-ligase